MEARSWQCQKVHPRSSSANGGRVFPRPSSATLRTMDLRLLGLCLLSALVAAPGCSRSEISPEVLAPKTEPRELDDTPLPVAEPNAIREVSEQSAPPLGAPCPTPAPVPPEKARSYAEVSPGSICGTKGRVALRAYTRSKWEANVAPCVPKELFGAKFMQDRACVGNGRLYFDSGCIQCRLPYMSVVEAEIAELTPQQLSNLQYHLRFSGSLRTASAWQSALTSGKRWHPPPH